MPKITYNKGLTTTVSDNILKTGRFSGSSISITNIPTGYRNLELHIINLRPSTDNTLLRMRFNDDSNANRYTNSLTTNTSSEPFGQTSFIVNPTGMDNGASSDGIIKVLLPSYSNQTTRKVAEMSYFLNNFTTPANLNYGVSFGAYNQTSAITSIQMFMSSGSFTWGTYVLYGII